MSSFRFDFGCDTNATGCEKSYKCESKSPRPQVSHAEESTRSSLVAKKHAWTNDIFMKMQNCKDKTSVSTAIFHNNKKLYHFTSEYVVQMYEEASSGVNNEINLSSHLIKSDLVNGVYEGGFKIWECSLDLTEYILHHEELDVQNKNVFELGCGAGLPAIMCLKLGASMVGFQDYNPEVIDYMTIPTVNLNNLEFNEFNGKTVFYSGDWNHTNVLLNNVNGRNTCDIILSSETIYNPQSYDDLFSFLWHHLSKNGVALFGAKSCYFGVGGSVEQFKSFISSKKCFDVKTVEEIVTNVKREIIEIRWTLV